MSYPIAVLIVLAAGLAAALVGVVLDRNLTLESRRRHHEVGSQIFQLTGIMYSVLLAFVFSEVWTEYNTAAQAINTECSAMHGTAMLANTLPHDDARRINAALLNYTHIVLRQEWRAMRDRQRTPEAAEALRGALTAAAQAPPGEVKAQILQLLAEAHAARETRLFQMGLTIPPAIWVVVIIIGVTLIGFVLLSATEPPGTVVLSASFTISIAMVLVLVRMLDYPFEGALALGNDDFQKIQRQLGTLLISETNNASIPWREPK